MFLSPEKIPTDPYSFSTYSKGSQCNSFMYDPEDFQTTASVVELRVSEFVNKSFKCEVSVFYTSSTLLDVIPTGFQSQMLWGFSFWCRSRLR